jgi:hypothetical protein
VKKFSFADELKMKKEEIISLDSGCGLSKMVSTKEEASYLFQKNLSFLDTFGDFELL